MDNNVGQNIKQRRLELGLTQDELAKRMGYKHRVSISTVENGHEDLTTERVRQFAKALNCSPAFLMGWDEDLMKRLAAFHKAILEGFKKAPIKDKKAVCAILDIPYQE